MKIGFVGLGKLGLPCALAIESRGHEVKGYDINPEIWGYIANREIPYREEGAEDLLKVTKIEVLDKLSDLLLWSDINFVAVQTPHDPAYEGITKLPETRVDFDYTHIITSIKEIIEITGAAEALLGTTGSGKGKQFIISIISTVLPGTMYREIFPLIPEGQTNLSIVYNPFFIAMGTTIKDFLFPEFVLLGIDDPYAAEVVMQFYDDTLPKSVKGERNGIKWEEVPPLFTCSINTAEAVKVLYNTYITQKICFANAAMELCEKTGADVDDLIECLQLGTRRITSGLYMRAGMGDGGGCHPRDNIALSFIAKKLDISYDWWENLMIAREKQTAWLADLIETEYFNYDCVYDIMIMGYTFKPETNLTIGSPALLLKELLLDDRGIPDEEVFMFDPFIDSIPTLIENEGSDPKNSLYKIYCEPRIFFIGTKHEQFKNYIFPSGSVVIDPFRYIPDQDGVTVKRIGQNNKSFQNL